MSSHIFSADREGGFHWYAPPPPNVTTVELSLEPIRLLTDAVDGERVAVVDRHRRAALVGEPPGLPGLRAHRPTLRPGARRPRPSLAKLGELVSARTLSRKPPRVISVPIRPAAVQVRSFAFPQPADAEALHRLPHARAGRRMPPTPGCTRIKPPRDVIKLKDRLHYLLQPPLEWLLAERSLAFPHDPFPFQLEGIAFLYPRQAAILADEMGLGKTMQAVTAIRLLLRCGELRTALVVCPKALVTNWEREFGLWAPEVPLLVIEGDQAKRVWQWQLPDMAVRIVNYELLCRDRQVLEHPPSEGGPPVRFDLVVLDESQRIKNRTGTTSEVARAISRKRNWALTGTPVENSAEDLVGIFEFLAAGLLSPHWKPRRLGRAVSDYVLRRTKDQVLSDLPPRLLRDTELDLSPQQRESYQLAEQRGVLRLTAMGALATIRHVFELVLRLKQICNFDPSSGASSKLEQLQADLEEIARSGRKAIVFSQWVGTLRELARRLRRFGPLEYHGRIPCGRRDAAIRRFREDRHSHVLLMTYGAGGVGLNLQFANYLFLFDRWWNPAVEDQATGRAHRIGVSGPVTVTRFLVRDTIEERIDRILQQKRELFEAIFSAGQAPRNLGLTQQELFGLFQLESPGGRIESRAAQQQ
jgi:SNF2 family DNA or RNA helicase